MSEKKELRWRQRFENFHKSYALLDQYIQKPIETELAQVYYPAFKKLYEKLTKEL